MSWVQFLMWCTELIPTEKDKPIFEFKIERELLLGQPSAPARPGVRLSGAVSEGVRGAQGHTIRGRSTVVRRRPRGERERGDRTLGSSERGAGGSPAARQWSGMGAKDDVDDGELDGALGEARGGS